MARCAVDGAELWYELRGRGPAPRPDRRRRERRTRATRRSPRRWPSTSRCSTTTIAATGRATGPTQRYTMDVWADDLARPPDAIGVERSTSTAGSMGGFIATRSRPATPSESTGSSSAAPSRSAIGWRARSSRCGSCSPVPTAVASELVARADDQGVLARVPRRRLRARRARARDAGRRPPGTSRRRRLLRRLRRDDRDRRHRRCSRASPRRRSALAAPRTA